MSPFQKEEGEPNFENFKKGGEPEKKFCGGGKQKGVGKTSNLGINLKFRDKKEQKRGLLETN